MSTGVKIQDTTRREKLKIILALGVPAMIENFLQTVVGFVDTLFVSGIGLNEVAAVGVSNTIVAVYLALFMALGVGASSLIARSIGAGDWNRARLIARQSTLLALAAGMVSGGVTVFFAESLLRLMGAEAAVIADGALYLRIVAVPSVLISLMTVFGSILRASGDTKTPMKVGIWMNGIHLVLDYVLIFGMLGFGGWGVAGAAWATVAARLFGVLALYGCIRKSRISFSLQPGVCSRELFGALLRLSGPAAVERLIMRTGQLLYFGMIIGLGTHVYAAHTIAGSIEIFSYMPGLGLAVAATTLVGQCMGAGRSREAFQYGVLSAGVAAVVMSFIGVLLFLFSSMAANWFTSDGEVIGMVTTALRIDAFAQPFLAIGLVLAGALQGAGDTKSPMYSTAVGMWLVRVVGVYVLSVRLGLGIAGIWLSIALDQLLRAAYLSWRFRLFGKKDAQTERQPSER